MIRPLVIALCGFPLIAAAAPLPVPPIPPAHPPFNEAAPVPDRDASGPSAEGARTRAKLEFYRMNRVDSSQGFVPGSRYWGEDDRRFLPSPGVSVRVPLDLGRP